MKEALLAFADSLSAFRWCPEHANRIYTCCNDACKKAFVLKAGFVYPHYVQKEGVLVTMCMPYCSLTCLCINEPPAGVG